MVFKFTGGMAILGHFFCFSGGRDGFWAGFIFFPVVGVDSGSV